MPVAADAEFAGRLARANAVAHEALRLRPVAPLQLLTANVDAALGEYFLPKGTSVALLPRPAALDEANFADPLAFRPERWLDPGSGPHDVSALTPFGSGPRMCPGRSLALLEMKTCLAMLCKSFDIERVGNSKDVAERFGFTMSPSELRVRLRGRGADNSAAQANEPGQRFL